MAVQGRAGTGAVAGFVPAVDWSLVERVQRGDEVATTALVAQVRPLVKRCASRFFSDPGRAEDLTQTALMKGFTRIHDVRAPAAFPAWLMRITRNECLNELSRREPRQVTMSALDDDGEQLESPAGSPGDPEASAARTELVGMVRRVTESLPPHYRRTLTMRALEDRSYGEISEALGVPKTVARLWYCRARKSFRRAFVDAIVARRDLPAGCVELADAITEMIEGRLPAARLAEVREHLAECADCRQTEDELRSTAFRGPSRLGALAIGLVRAPRTAQRSVEELAHRVADEAQQLVAKLAVGTGLATIAAVGAPALATVPPLVAPSVVVALESPHWLVGEPPPARPAAGQPPATALPGAVQVAHPAAGAVALGISSFSAPAAPPAPDPTATAGSAIGGGVAAAGGTTPDVSPSPPAALLPSLFVPSAVGPTAPATGLPAATPNLRAPLPLSRLTLPGV